MANEVVGTCDCPLCNAPGAEVRRGEKQRLYIVCDDCVSMIRTQSRKGQTCINDRMAGQRNPVPAPVVDPDPAPTPTPTPAPKHTPKKPGKSAGSWHDVFGLAEKGEAHA